MKKSFKYIGAVLGVSIVMVTGCGSSKDSAKAVESKPAYYEQYGFSDNEKPVAFLGADGYGKETVGGRGGKVYHVTNLNDSGEGSLRWAIEQKGARTVVFDVSGIIELETMLTVSEPNITIAGQTAPGDGICLKNYGIVVNADEVIIRYLRSRPGGSQETDGLWVKECKNVVIDHVSASWGTDETLSVSGSDKVTVMNCIISESLNVNKFGTHGMGSLVRGSDGQQVTFMRNIYATHRSRMPMCGNYSTYKDDEKGFNFEFVNNLVYNWSGQAAGKNHDTDSITRYNLINNVYLAGPVSTDNYAWSEGCSYTQMYMEGNMMNGEIPEDQYSLVEIEEDNVNFSIDKYKLSNAYEDSMITTLLDTDKVEEALLENAGASFKRDEIDTALIQGIKDGVGKIVNKPEQSIGWSGQFPKLESEEAPSDKDKDGIPDKWEEKAGLDALDETDGALETGCGYTNLEIYLESLIKK